MQALPSQGLLENLVTQFSNALDCFRELVQNSIDAGSPRVEIAMAFEATVQGEGVIAIHVEDFGHGMDEAIIDGQFTRLFDSTKGGDLTKIGKFGIGFVSVFALKPHAVLVHTGRNGEYWEVLFHADRSFTKTRLDDPVEGTRVSLYLAGDEARYEELAGEIPATLRRWCSHVEVEITFEDRTQGTHGPFPLRINAPFAVSGACAAHVEHPGTKIALGYAERPEYGFYNRGLALHVTRAGAEILGTHASRLGHVSFKVDSRYLEHTLARETVLRDAHFDRAMRLVEAAANEVLAPRLLDALETLVAQPSWSLAEVVQYGTLAGFLAQEPLDLLTRVEARPLVRLVNGRATSLRALHDIYRRDGRLLVRDSPTPLCDRLAGMGVPVVLGALAEDRAPDALRNVARLLGRVIGAYASQSVLGQGRRLMRWVFGQAGWSDAPGGSSSASDLALLAPEDVYLSVAMDDSPPPELAPLLAHAAELLRVAGAGYRSVGSFEPLAMAEEAPLFVVAPHVGPLMARPTSRTLRGRSRQMEAAVNRSHPHLTFVQSVAKRDLAMGTYMLAKSLLLDEDRELGRDGTLIDAALDLIGPMGPDGART